MDFSFEQLHEIHAFVDQLHATFPGSGGHFPTGPAGSLISRTGAKKTRSGAKRARFTQKDDARLVDLKESKR
jgi:hypothetical protein